MKQQVEKLINTLTDKTLSFGCELLIEEGDVYSNRIVIEGYDYYLEPPVRLKYLGNYFSGCGDFDCCGDYGTKYALHDIKNIVCIEEDISNIKKFKIIGHPIMLTDVIEKIQEKHGVYSLDIDKCDVGHYLDLLESWEQCGFTKSLQQIVEESGWETKEYYQGEQEPLLKEQLKDENANDLANLLIDIFEIR